MFLVELFGRGFDSRHLHLVPEATRYVASGSFYALFAPLWFGTPLLLRAPTDAARMALEEVSLAR